MGDGCWHSGGGVGIDVSVGSKSIDAIIVIVFITAAAAAADAIVAVDVAGGFGTHKQLKRMENTENEWKSSAKAFRRCRLTPYILVGSILYAFRQFYEPRKMKCSRQTSNSKIVWE